MAKKTKKQAKAEEKQTRLEEANGFPLGTMPTSEDGPELPDEMVLLPVSQTVLFPGMVAPIALSEESTLHLKLAGISDNKFITVATQKSAPEPLNGKGEAPLLDRVYQIATAAVVLKLMKGPDGQARVLLHGLNRVKLQKMRDEKSYPLVKVSKLIDPPFAESPELEAVRRQVARVVGEIVEVTELPDEFQRACEDITDPGRLADLVASNVSFKPDEQQDILGTRDPVQRLYKTYEYLERLLRVLQIGHKIQNEVRQEIEQNQRDFFLREQIKQLKTELGDNGDYPEEEEDLLEALAAKNLPEEANEAAKKEIHRLGRINPASPEHSVTRSYIDWILDLPWNDLSPVSEDIDHAREVLDEDHYSLTEVKDRILEYLSVMKLTDNLRGPILCFVGPPGVGKTSLGRSIARATNREFFRFSLGGLRDEAEIRGHRRTYIGAMPGRIIKAFKTTKARNPVIMLDEIDKLGSDFRGDPASALLEVLDPEQNSNFVDNYLDLPFDLSQTLFITTANVLEQIPSALRDRMEVIRLSGYTLREKRIIAQRYLIPRQRKENGLKRAQISFTKEAIDKIMEDYTREAGLREAERQIGRVCRKVARKIAEGSAKTAKISPRTVSQYLGQRRYTRDMADRVSAPGICIGLAWTQFGGEILYIEANSTPGEGKLRLTGQLGDVMKESAHAALSFLLANGERLGIPMNRIAERDFHIHLPAGAIPKDGPSAGIGLTTAIAGEALNKRIKKGIGMTGEITLKGNVLAVGGIKEKMLAASRAGLKKVILPEANRKDLEDVPAEVKKKLEFLFVENAEQVLPLVFPKR